MLLATNYQLPTAHKGFALIFVLLFATIALMVGTSIVVALISGMKLNRQTQQGTEAYYLARGGIDAAVNQLRESQVEHPVWPTTGCSKFTIYYYNNSNSKYEYVAGEFTMPEVNVWINSNSGARKDGFYAARLCESSSVIESIGFFQGRKITLKAKIKNNPTPIPKLITYTYSKNVCSDPNPANCPNPTAYTTTTATDQCMMESFTNATLGNCVGNTNYNNKTSVVETLYDHFNDLIKIYQTGS